MLDQTHVNLIQLVGGHLKKQGGYHVGPCPLCGGEDRFYVNESKQAWGCRKCSPGYNDALAFVAKRDGLNLSSAADFKQAAALLDVDLPANREFQQRQQQRTPTPANPVGDMDTEYACFDPAWQTAAYEFVGSSVSALWDGEDQRPFDYLRQRGIEEWCIARYQLGFNAHDHSEQWGETSAWLPRGVVLPWVMDATPDSDTYWRIRFRTADPANKYRQVAGAGNGLFIAGGPLRRNCAVVLVEGELDALSLVCALWRHSRATGDSRLQRSVVAVATGGTTQARVLRWVVSLSVVRRVLVAYDADDAGQHAAAWWLERLSNGVRWLPTRKDINDMVLAGEDVEAWIIAGLTHDSIPTQQRLLDVRQPVRYA